MFNPELKRRLKTDASNAYIGGVLEQIDDHLRGDLRTIDRGSVKSGIPETTNVICYLGRKLNKHEINYSTSEKEMLAVVYCILKCRTYLIGCKFELQTDHKALCHLLNLKDPCGRLARQALTIQEYDYVPVYVKGSHHSVADGISRPTEALAAMAEIEPDISQDEDFRAFLEFGKMPENIQANKKRRFHNMQKYYKISDSKLWYRRAEDESYYEVPDLEKRVGIVERLRDI